MQKARRQPEQIRVQGAKTQGHHWTAYYPDVDDDVDGGGGDDDDEDDDGGGGGEDHIRVIIGK